MEPLELEFTVACSPEHAFEVGATKTTPMVATGSLALQ
jgi:hypothetical protein